MSWPNTVYFAIEHIITDTQRSTRAHCRCRCHRCRSNSFGSNVLLADVMEVCRIRMLRPFLYLQTHSINPYSTICIYMCLCIYYDDDAFPLALFLSVSLSLAINTCKIQPIVVYLAVWICISVSVILDYMVYNVMNQNRMNLLALFSVSQHSNIVSVFEIKRKNADMGTFGFSASHVYTICSIRIYTHTVSARQSAIFIWRMRNRQTNERKKERKN